MCVCLIPTKMEVFPHVDPLPFGRPQDLQVSIAPKKKALLPER